MYFTNILFMFQKYTPHYKNIKTNLSLNKRNYSTIPNNNHLGPYLAGLIEGDGSILVPGKESNWIPNIEIVFGINDLKLIQNSIYIRGRLYNY